MLNDLADNKYIVAVSGGVDSTLLLELMAETVAPGDQLIVAHFDHGIRSDSASDEQFVAALAKSKNLTYISERAELGANASEAEARTARYDFLRRVKDQFSAKAIYTAHHKDDLLETIVMNLQRGTGRTGLDPMRSHTDIERPLLYYTKQELIDHAKQRGLTWRTDSTNANPRYTRNRIRASLANVHPYTTEKLYKLHTAAVERNNEINALLKELATWVLKDGAINRARFVVLPYAVQKEFILHWLQANNIKDISRPLVERVTHAVKTARPGSKQNLLLGKWLLIQKNVVKILQK